MFDSFQEETIDRNLIKNTPGVKRSSQELKKALLKGVKSNGWPMPPGFDRFQTFGHDELTTKHCDFRSSRPPDVDGIKILIKMTRPQNIKISFLLPSNLYQKF